MSRTFFIILISVFLFIGINTIFYFSIYKQQLDFQTELLARQTRICGSTMEQEGQRFENELNSIPYQDDVTRLFIDEAVKQRGSTNLQKLYSGYSELINKITVYDHNKNVYSLILDSKNNFVSDYYESQQQVPLAERDELILRQGRYLLSIPGFDEGGIVRSNILVDINFTRFANEIFKRYGVEEILWQCLVSEEGELISSLEEDISISDGDQRRISSDIRSETEGSMVHSIMVDSVSTRVVSYYYPIRLVKRNLGIIFSIKSDLFLRSIIYKIIIISFCSILLFVLLLYIHFKVVKVRSGQIRMQKTSEESLMRTFHDLPFPLLFINPDGRIRMMNQAARSMLPPERGDGEIGFSDLGLEDLPEAAYTVYQRTFGHGSVKLIRNKPDRKHFYALEWDSEIGDEKIKIVLLINISEFENRRNLEKISQAARTELLQKMAREIRVPLDQLQKTIRDLEKKPAPGDIAKSSEILQKSSSLLSNLIHATLEFAEQEAAQVVLEEIPFFLRAEIDVALEPYRRNPSNTSIITKIRNDVPDNLIGDPFRLRQVIASLVENALELTDDGRILISAETIEQHSGSLKLQFQVEDTGSGLPGDQIQQLSEKTGPDAEPLAKRLSTARLHVELMKGYLWLESPSSISTSPDHPGMKYIFTIEVIPGEPLKENLSFQDIRQPGEIECLILSQEKETDNEQFDPLVHMGIKPSYLVYRKENMDSLFELVAQKKAGNHLIIVMHTPDQDGFPTARELVRKDLAGDQILILLSTVHRQENYALSRNAGIDYYLEYPYEPYLFVEIFTRHFPGLDRNNFKQVPELIKIRQDLAILLAEDNLFNRKVVQGLFKSMGLEIDLAENGSQAVGMVRDREYDIIFLDLLMPEMDGLQAAAEIRKTGFKGPLIALTAVEDEEIRSTALQAHFNDYLIKPASKENLRKILIEHSSKSR